MASLGLDLCGVCDVGFNSTIYNFLGVYSESYQVIRSNVARVGGSSLLGLYRKLLGYDAGQGSEMWPMKKCMNRG